jgi:hypothetical protein
MKLIHWNYFLALEDDLLHLSRFIEFSKKNFKTYSLELAHLLLASTSEIDVILKALCHPFASSATEEQDYMSSIPRNIPAFTEIKVEMPRYDLTFQPWHSWSKNQTPVWWTAYNKVKHKRNDYYEEANLKNVFQSMAGLFISNLYLYKDLANRGWLSPWSHLFVLEDKYVKGSTPAEGGWTSYCNL